MNVEKVMAFEGDFAADVVRNKFLEHLADSMSLISSSGSWLHCASLKETSRMIAMMRDIASGIVATAESQGLPTIAECGLELQRWCRLALDNEDLEVMRCLMPQIKKAGYELGREADRLCDNRQWKASRRE
ncbi:hypothetical protein HCH_01629 [Hahella chejuensis KCTC 2396]|uniref:Uncharacterized protein n=1 Tax=Hahella chejuensis (strain KCTC 2396) TaxID=349521 RepID=Q2SLI9_HAHCH|nr:hypothetical protein [Hahella chejuensis]ABC28485.1 hypothetical protein HCH_01629 [Hahella chejuensis KCTC 2396]